MIGTKQTKGGIVDAVAAARDEALVEIGREAAARQQLRQKEFGRGNGGAFAVAALAAGAAIAAGAVAYRARQRKNGKSVAQPNGRPVGVNGTVSEHEHEAEHEEALAMSRR